MSRTRGIFRRRLTLTQAVWPLDSTPWAGDPFDTLQARSNFLFDSTRGGMLNASDEVAAFPDNVAKLQNLGTNASDAEQATDANRGQCLGSSRMLYCPRVNGNGARITYQDGMDVTGDIDIRVMVCLEGFPSNQMLATRDPIASLDRSWSFFIRTNRRLDTAFYHNSGSVVAAQSSASCPFFAGDVFWARVTRVALTGDVTFYTSPDGETWTQLGTTKSTTAGDLRASTDDTYLGYRPDGNSLGGAIYGCEIYSSVDGTNQILQADFTDTSWAHGALHFRTQVGDFPMRVTQAGGGQNLAMYAAIPFVRMDGTANDFYLSTFDAAMDDGAYMFAVYEVRGTNGTDRVVSAGRAADNDTAADSYIFSLFISDGLSTYHTGQTLTHEKAYQGRFLHEALSQPGGISSTRNGFDVETANPGSLVTQTYEELGIGGSFHDGGNNASIDLYFLAICDPDTPAEELETIRNYVNNTFEVYDAEWGSDEHLAAKAAMESHLAVSTLFPDTVIGRTGRLAYDFGTVASWANQGYDAEDPSRSNDSQRPRFFPPGEYLYLPGTANNSIELPLGNDTYDYTATYLDGTTYSDTVVVASGVFELGGVDANFTEVGLTSISVELDGDEVALFTASAAEHGSTSHTDTYANDWTVNQDSDDPARINHHAGVASDGVNDALAGDLSSVFNGGTAVLMYDVLGGGGESSGRIFTVSDDPNHEDQAGGASFQEASGGSALRSYFGSLASAQMSISASYSGRISAVVRLTDVDSCRHLVNGDTETTTDNPSLTSDRFAIFAGTDSDNFSALHLTDLFLMPEGWSDSEIDDLRAALESIRGIAY